MGIGWQNRKRIERRSRKKNPDKVKKTRNK